ncbi:hypothetical protein ACFFX0_26050 [Citricoccus parietis]|uniref:Uncharacterized protein n=1 Tax=Citricoccus parietis TaxID=592307 RepID=A0ABV5G6B9_9MICC
MAGGKRFKGTGREGRWQIVMSWLSCPCPNYWRNPAPWPPNSPLDWLTQDWRTDCPASGGTRQKTVALTGASTPMRTVPPLR